MEVILETQGLCKSFGEQKVNNDISLKLHKGEIMAILGENGSGKTTLINMISGLYYPDKGRILYKGKEVKITSPKDADLLEIGVVHQHFQLVSNMSAIENIEIALESHSFKDKNEIKDRISDITKKYEFNINPDKKIYEMSVSEKQTVEIIKAIIKGAEILILDEPTAVLTPGEAESLFNILKAMKEDGKSIIIITHKLNEVLEISDRVYIMRKGRHVDTLLTKETDGHELACKMVGQQINLEIERTEYKRHNKILEIKNLCCLGRNKKKGLNNISFELFSGEILGVAGISGSGQKELCECINGIRSVSSGAIKYYSHGKEIDLTNKKPEWRNCNNIDFGFVPEDRLGMGLSPSSNLVDNMMIKNYKNEPGIFLHRKKYEKLAKTIVKKLNVATKDINTPVRMLSGGNVQKILLGREIAEGRDVLIVSYPVRGLDITSAYMIYNILNKEREKGTAIIFVGEDLDVLMGIADRIMVMSDYEVTGIVNPKSTTKEYIGSLMMETEKVV